MRRKLDPGPPRPRATAAAAVLAGCLLVATTGPPAASAGGPTLDESVLVAAGRKEFRRYCVSCHGIGGRGDGPVAPALAAPVPDLTRIAQRHDGSFPAGEVAAFIDGRTMVDAHGTRLMPVWGERLSDEIQPDTAEEVTRGRITLMVAYLESIQR